MLTVTIVSSFTLTTPTEGETKETATIQEQTVEETKVLFTEQELTNLVYAAADKHGANRERLLYTVKCEAPKETIDGVLIYDASRKSEYAEFSWGLAQWHIPSGNKNFEGTPVTRSQARDAKYSVELMAKYFANGDAYLWSCYKSKYGKT